MYAKLKSFIAGMTLFGCLFSGCVYAQVLTYQQAPKTMDWGPRLGFTTSTLAADDLGKSGIRFSFIAGAFVRYQLTERFSVQLDAVYADRGGTFDGSSVLSGKGAPIRKLGLGYLDFPLTAIYNVRYKLAGKQLHFDLFAGIQPAVLIRATLNQSDVKSYLNGFDSDVVVGSGFTIGRVILYATTKIGLLDVNNELENSPLGAPAVSFIRNLSTEWTIGYKF